jgi:hypothetical protein
MFGRRIKLFKLLGNWSSCHRKGQFVNQDVLKVKLTELQWVASPLQAVGKAR